MSDWEPRPTFALPDDMWPDVATTSAPPPLPRKEIEDMKKLMLLAYEPPYTVDEIKELCPGLYTLPRPN